MGFRGFGGHLTLRGTEKVGFGFLGLRAQGPALRWGLSAAFLPVLSNFLVTAGSDRKIKFWDLRRLYEPINSIKRFLSTEVAWLLPYNGVTVAQDNCYAS